MSGLILACALPGVLIWFGVLLAPWRPWSTREHLEPAPDTADADLAEITVLIPARNEAEVIATTLAAVHAQGRGLSVVLIDDQSEDATASIARSFPNTTVIAGQTLPEGWAGKLWALEQGRRHTRTPLTLLLDADIELRPGMLAALLAHKRANGVHFVSLMADLRRTGFWDRLLLPAFVYFFKLLYPFALSNAPRIRWVAAAAGGCVLVDTAALEKAGAFASLRGALIDDCALAGQVKRAGFRTWIGLSRGVISLRPYGSLSTIHEMVTRSAFTQLRYSLLLLLLVTATMAAAFWLPVLACFIPGARAFGITAWLALAVSYAPTLRYYGESPLWGLAMPLTGTLYLAMTWSSALRYWRGTRSRWKGRVYARPQQS